jgi:desulfoferrodoxin (superoxide reductase-like protein)
MHQEEPWSVAGNPWFSRRRRPLIRERRSTHVPVVEKSAKGIVKLRSVPLPMEKKHTIGWIEVRRGNYVFI